MCGCWHFSLVSSTSLLSQLGMCVFLCGAAKEPDAWLEGEQAGGREGETKEWMWTARQAMWRDERHTQLSRTDIQDLETLSCSAMATGQSRGKDHLQWVWVGLGWVNEKCRVAMRADHTHPQTFVGCGNYTSVVCNSSISAPFSFLICHHFLAIKLQCSITFPVCAALSNDHHVTLNHSSRHQLLCLACVDTWRVIVLRES